jgi:hypothetical protein
VYISTRITDDSDEARRVYRRTKDDLPLHVKGKAFWIDSPFGTGYYVDYAAGTAPVEFVENHWYHLTHNPIDDTYWTTDNKQIQPNKEGTGYWFTLEPEHPEYQQLPSPSVFTPRESQAPIPEDAPTESPFWFATPPGSDELEYLEELTVVDTVHTDILTSALDQIASFQDPEPAPDSPECEPSQLKNIIITTAQAAVYTNPDVIDAAYPESTTPLHPVIQQIQLPVIRIHPPMANVQPQAGAPQAAPQQAPAGAPGPAPLTNGLRGIVSDKFDGDRTKTNTFLWEFDILWNMNKDNEMFQSPYLRINLALSLIRGPNVNNWIQAQIEELCRRLAPGGGFTQDQEALWTNFRNTLTTAFTNTTERQRAVTALHDLKMKGDDLDTYVARFRALARKAGHPLDNPGTMDNFARGLKKGLLTAILT